MQTELSARFARIEQQRLTLQNQARSLSETQQRWKPRETDWNTLQIVEHLVLSDEIYGRKQAAEDLKSEMFLFRLLPRAWRRAFALRALRRDAVLPLPSPDIAPPGNVALERLLSRWEAARSDMRHELNQVGENETCYAHPILGPLTAAQLLELGQTHLAYHTRQMEKLQRHPAFPPHE